MEERASCLQYATQRADERAAEVAFKILAKLLALLDPEDRKLLETDLAVGGVPAAGAKLLDISLHTYVARRTHLFRRIRALLPAGPDPVKD